MAGLQGKAEAVTLHERLDAFMRDWGSTSTSEWQLMRNELLLIVAAAKREEAEETGRAVNRVIDEAFRSEV